MNLFQQSIIQRLHLIQVINPCIQCVADIAGDFLSFTLSIKQCLADLQSPIAQLIPFPQHQLTHLNVPKCNFCNRLALRPLILKITESFSEEDLEFFVTQNLSANFAPHETSDIVWKLKQLLRTYQLSKNQTPDLVNMGVQTQNIDPINYKKQFFQIGRILNIHRLCPEDILEAVKKQVQTIQHYEKSQFQTQIAELRKQNTDLMHENVLMKRENSKLLEYQKYGLKSRPQSHIVSPPTQPNHAETHKILRQYSLNPTNDISDRRQKFTECMTAKRQVTTTKTQIYTLEQEVERLKSKKSGIELQSWYCRLNRFPAFGIKLDFERLPSLHYCRKSLAHIGSDQCDFSDKTACSSQQREVGNKQVTPRIHKPLHSIIQQFGLRAHYQRIPVTAGALFVFKALHPY